MERVKDFLYDVSDLFFSLLIIGIIFFIVSWKLTDTMAVTWFSNIDDNAPVAELPIDTTPIVDDIVVEDETDPVVEDVVEDETEPVQEEVVEIQDVNFEVSPGSTGYKIAVKLQEEGLIEDVDSFIQTLGDLGLGNKLRAGNFKLNTGMTVEEIIKKLAGQ